MRVVAVVIALIGAALLLTGCSSADTEAFEELQEQLRPVGAVDNPGCRTSGGSVQCDYSVPGSAREIAGPVRALLEREGFSISGPLLAFSPLHYHEFDTTSSDGETRIIFHALDGPREASLGVEGEVLTETIPAGWSWVSIRISDGDRRCAIDCVDTTD